MGEIYFAAENWQELKAGNLRVLEGSVRFNETTGALECGTHGWHLIYDLLTGAYTCPECRTTAFFLLRDQLMVHM